jgi:hypothetical protein
VPLQIFKFRANSKLFFERAAQNQFIALEAWKYELESRFKKWQLKQPITKIRIR